MNFSKTALRGVALVAFLTASPIAVQAGQLIEGCHPTAKMQEMLKAQGQKPMIVADDFGLYDKAAALITSNEDGSLGYFVTGNKPMAENSTKFCVNMVYTDVKMYSPDLKEPPKEAFIGGTKEVALKACADEGRDSCGFYDESIVSGYKNGYRMLLRGNILKEANGELYKSDRVIDFSADMRTGYGAQFNGFPSNGIRTATADLEGVKITPFGEAMLGKNKPPVQVTAAIDPAAVAIPVSLSTEP